MSRKSIAGKLALSLAMFFMIGSFAALGVTQPPASPASLDCSTAKDVDIINEVIKNIRATFRNNDIKLRLRFNIFCNQGKVELKGAAISNTTVLDATKKQVIDIAKATDCVKSVKASKLGVVNAGDCGPNEQPCNGGCIGRNEVCHPISEN